MQNIYSVTPPPPEEHHDTIEDIQIINQGMQAQIYDLEGMAQDNAVVTRSKSVVMAQLSHMTVTMNDMQAQLKSFAYAQTNRARPKRKQYCWICRSNFTHERKTCSSKKAGHQDEVYYNKSLGGSEKGCE